MYWPCYRGVKQCDAMCVRACAWVCEGVWCVCVCVCVRARAVYCTCVHKSVHGD